MTVRIDDYTPLTAKILAFRKKGDWDRARRLLPKERVYPVPDEIARRLGMAQEASSRP